MKVLITGASGLLGRAIKFAFDEVKVWNVQGCGFNRLSNGLKKVDLRDENEIRKIINDFRPDVVIHSAAERNYSYIAKHEKEALLLNATSSEVIAKAVNEYGGFVLP